MEFIEELRALSTSIKNSKDKIQTEEATKNAFIMPFIKILGYNVFDPFEVTPEIVADIGIKKGEKVDYAILKDNKPIMLFECKSCKVNLNDEEKSQLCRYFQAIHDVRFGILTNGIIYRFFTDLEKPNIMDDKPFLEINLLDLKENITEDLKKFCKENFNLNNNLSSAEELKYTKEIKRILSEQFKEPNDEFIKFFAHQIYSGSLTQAIKDKFKVVAKKAFSIWTNEKLEEILKNAIDNPPPSVSPSPTQPQPDLPRIITTDDEKEAHIIIKSILRTVIDSDKISLRDALSYCSILFDDNNRKPICRLYFSNKGKKQIIIFDKNKIEEKILLNRLDDLYNYSDKFIELVKNYIITP